MAIQNTGARLRAQTSAAATGRYLRKGLVASLASKATINVKLPTRISINLGAIGFILPEGGIRLEMTEGFVQDASVGSNQSPIPAIPNLLTFVNPTQATSIINSVSTSQIFGNKIVNPPIQFNAAMVFSATARYSPADGVLITDTAFTMTPKVNVIARPVADINANTNLVTDVQKLKIVDADLISISSTTAAITAGYRPTLTLSAIATVQAAARTDVFGRADLSTTASININAVKTAEVPAALNADSIVITENTAIFGLTQNLTSVASVFARATDGNLWVWGRTDGGRLALTPTSEPIKSPTLNVLNNQGFQWNQIMSTGNYPTWTATYAIRDDNTLWKLAANSPLNTPQQLGSVNSWKKLATGQFNTYGLRNNGTLWTNIASGGTTQFGTASDWSDIAVASDRAIAIKNNGTLWTWTGTTPSQVGVATDWVKVFAQQQTYFAIKSNGTLWSWGSNDLGQTALGLSSGTTGSPTQVGTATWQEVTGTGGNTFIGLQTNGSLWSWGSNANGVNGRGINNSETFATTPQRIGTANDWNILSAAFSIAAVAIKDDASAWSWGSNFWSAPGQGTWSGDPEAIVAYTTPQQIGTSTNWLKAFVGHDGVYAIRRL